MRDLRIDFLRFLGLSLIILAHVDPPNWLFQARNFDVPLMVLVSGLSFGKTSNSSMISYFGYVWRRIRRLLLPMWIFLSVYFIVLRVFFEGHELLNLKSVIGSYALLGVIGSPYTWIIRVFLMVAVIAPFIKRFSDRVQNNWIYLMIWSAVYALYEVLLSFTLEFSDDSTLFKLESLIAYYEISYGLIFALGIRLHYLSQRQIKAFGIVALGVFLTLGLITAFQEKQFPNLQVFKYPPTAYYISYALAISSILWLLIEPILQGIHRIKSLEKFVLFTSRNSMWLFIWHIPAVEIFRGIGYENTVAKYVIAYGFAALLTWIQSEFIQKFVLNSLESDSLKKNIKLVFTG